MIKEENKVVFLHTPKTGGGAMEYFFYDEFKKIRRNYFLSFFGVDDSRFIHDENSTQRKNGNHCLIEGIFRNPTLVEDFKNSPHFQQSKILFGHTTYGLGELFPEYNFQYLTVLREPIERTISNIAQFCNILKGNIVKFGSYTTEYEKFSDEYWDWIYEILTKEYPTKGLLLHENLYLKNCMTRVLSGGKYTDLYESENLDLALENSGKIKISFFDNFNDGLQKSFNDLNITIDMSKNIKAKHGKPEDNNNKKKHGIYYNAPQKLIDFVTEKNQVDIKLYDILKNKL